MNTNERRELITTPQGVCRHCMGAPAKPGLKHCEKCLQFFRDRRKARKAQGLCPHCGGKRHNSSGNCQNKGRKWLY